LTSTTHPALGISTLARHIVGAGHRQAAQPPHCILLWAALSLFGFTWSLLEAGTRLLHQKPPLTSFQGGLVFPP